VDSHARQSPHLSGMSDPEIRTLAQRAMSQHPRTRLIRRVRNIAVLLGMLAGYLILTWRFDVDYDPGSAMMIVGGVGTIFVLIWNLVWVNTVLFRLTRLEVGEQEPPNGSPPARDAD